MCRIQLLWLALLALLLAVVGCNELPEQHARDEVASDSERDPSTEDAATSRPRTSAVPHNTPSTPFANFMPSVTAAFSLTLVTEFGDRTFFIAALMSLKYPRVLVFVGTASALLVQTAVSTLVGRLLHLLPGSAVQSLHAIPLDDYAAALLLFFFGMLHMKAACWTPPVSQARVYEPKSVEGEFEEAKEAVERVQYQQLGHQPAEWKILKETFWIIFVAELGDKSMIATIALATAQNPYGVLLGGSAAHCIVTLVAIIAGSLLQGYISEKVANIVGAILFLTFAVLTTIEGLTRQGYVVWGSAVEKVAAMAVAYVALDQRGFRSGFRHMAKAIAAS